MSLGPLGFGPLAQSGALTAEDIARLFNPRRLDGTGATLTQDGTADLPAGVAEHVNAGGDISAMFGGAPMGAPQGFTGSATAPMVSSSGFRPHRADAPADGDGPVSPPLQIGGIRPSQAAPLSLGPLPGGAAPAAVPSDDRGAPVAADFQPAPLPSSEQRARLADAPAEGAVPTAGQMPPLTFTGAPQPANPTVSAASPATPAPQAPADEGFNFGDAMKRFNASGGSDLMTNLGVGLLTTHGFGAGVGAGLQANQKQEALRSTADLARAEYGLKATKLAREAKGENATRNYLLGKGMDANLADAAMSNPTVLSSTLSQLNKDPTRVTVGGNIYELKPGERPSQSNLLGSAEASPEQVRARAQASAEGAAAGKPEDTTADQKNFEEAKKGGYTGSFLDYQVLKANAGKAQTTINNAVNPVLKGLGDQFVESAANARSASDAARAVQTARSQIDAPGGVITGSFANDRLKLQKLGSFLGVADPSSIQNTETFRTQIKPLVLETVKGLGAGSGISNADRDFAAEAVGGNINLDEGTIRRVLDITERAARSKVERHNKLAGQMLETQPELKQIAPMLQVEMPAMATQPAPNTPPQGLPQGARQAPDGNWYTPDPSRPGKFLRVQ